MGSGSPRSGAEGGAVGACGQGCTGESLSYRKATMTARGNPPPTSGRSVPSGRVGGRCPRTCGRREAPSVTGARWSGDSRGTWTTAPRIVGRVAGASGRSAARERGGVGLGVGAGLHNVSLCKGDPGRLRPGGARGRGGARAASDKKFLIGRRSRKERDRTGQGWPGLARALPSGADSPVFFLRSAAE